MIAKMIILLYVAATSAALVVLKFSSEMGPPISIVDGRFSLNINTYTFLGAMLFGLSFLLYTYLISSFHLGYIVPVTTALVYIIIFSLSYFLFDEQFTPTKSFGIILILSGLILLHIGSNQ
jgi:drug/metabolite transporter (DMT)-like permease